MDIRKENKKVIDFHKRLGVKIIGETEADLLGHYYFEDYKRIREDIVRIFENQNS